MPFRGFVCKPEIIPVCVPLLILRSKIWAHNKMSGYSALQRSPDSCSSGRRIRHQSIKRKGQTQTFPHKTDDTNNLVEYSTSGICHRVTTSGSITQQKEMSCIVSTAPHWELSEFGTNEEDLYSSLDVVTRAVIKCSTTRSGQTPSSTRRLKMLLDEEET